MLYIGIFLYVSVNLYNFRKNGGIFILSNKEEMCMVRSLDLANYLCGQGFKIKNVIDSDKNPRFKIFLFEDSKKIQCAINTYLHKKGV